MIKLSKYIVSSLLFFVVWESVYGNCALNSPNDLLERFKTKHPQALENRVSLKIADKLVDVATQRPNLEMQVQNMQGEEPDGDAERLSLSISHTIELGGKHGARVDLAESQRNQMKYWLKDSNEDILIDAILKAYRLRQVKELIPIYEEAYQAFNKILKIKQRRKSLSPEEQVEMETLILATNDYRLKVSKLGSEKINLSKHLSFFIGESCEFTESILPRDVDLSKNFAIDTGELTYAKLQSATKYLDVANHQLELERSKAYPNLKIGPSFAREKIDGVTYQSAGILLSMEIPILNTNSGGKGQAVEKINRAKLRLEHVKREAELDLEAWIQKYNSLRVNLKSIATSKDLESKHVRIEKLFKRGVISTAMIIESHRQLIEFAKTRYEFELGAAEALWNIYKLKGTALTEKL